MNGYLTINSKIIVRDSDKMIFSAKEMKIYKFNDKGYNVVKILYENKKILKSLLFEKINDVDIYSEKEFNDLIKKMLDCNIIIEESE